MRSPGPASIDESWAEATNTATTAGPPRTAEETAPGLPSLMKSGFSTWQEFLACEEDCKAKLGALLRANLRFTDPKSLRPQ